MKSDLDSLREEIRQLHLKHARGDLREKPFQRGLARRTMELCRATVEKSMAAGERILHEHHVIQAHVRFAQSVLKEPEQTATSLYMTERSLIRLRSNITPGRPTTCDEGDNTVVDHISLKDIAGTRVHRRIRPGEICVGLAMIAFAYLFYDSLDITGALMVGLGALGALHGLLLPTRWIEVKTAADAPSDPILIHAVGKKSGRKLVKLLRAKIRAVPALALAL